MPGIDTSAPVDEIIMALAKHKIPIVLIDAVFDRVKKRVSSETVVTSPSVNQESLVQELLRPRK